MKNQFEKAEKQTELMRSMADKVGVDWSDLVAQNPELSHKFRHATLTCGQCKAAGECVDWQNEHDQAEHAPDYCRNKKIFEELRTL